MRAGAVAASTIAVSWAAGDDERGRRRRRSTQRAPAGRGPRPALPVLCAKLRAVAALCATTTNIDATVGSIANISRTDTRSERRQTGLDPADRDARAIESERPGRIASATPINAPGSRGGHRSVLTMVRHACAMTLLACACRACISVPADARAMRPCGPPCRAFPEAGRSRATRRRHLKSRRGRCAT